ncbi:MAG: anaerobic ribonucleoside-triphosphate reductase activating protein [Firmicutes bacterium]|nr:anaerobic ribonucleoside-triphosphate reductase activating protein [Bacillota bacterium]
MYYGNIKKTDIADGPGVRVSLFVSGCTHCCKGCFNSETWDFKYGKPFAEETADEIIKALAPSHIAGFTVLGGEPFEPENQKELAPLLKRIKETYPEKDIWCYSGYLLDEELLKESRARCEYTDEMLKYIDVLVDGEFVQAKRSLMINYRGSTNQRIIMVKESLKEGKIVLSEYND